MGDYVKESFDREPSLKAENAPETPTISFPTAEIKIGLPKIPHNHYHNGKPHISDLDACSCTCTPRADVIPGFPASFPVAKEPEKGQPKSRLQKYRNIILAPLAVNPIKSPPVLSRRIK